MGRPAWGVIQLISAFVACAGLSVVDASAQGYPSRPIRMVVGYVPGGAVDVTARLMGQKLSEYLGQPVVVENRPGASGSIADERVAKSSPDGYTVLMIPASATVQPALRSNLPYDLERDLAPVSLVVIGPYALVVHVLVPARNVKELITLARAQPGKLNYGSAGIGSSQHLTGELFNLMAKVTIAHVPFKGSGESSVANAAGHVQMSFPSITAALPLLEAGKLRLLAVTSLMRTSLMPTIPTLNESGLPGYDRSGWYGVLAPAGVPKNVVAQLNAAIGRIVGTPEMKEAFKKQGLEPQPGTPEEFAARIRSEIVQNAKLVKLAGAKAE